MSDAPLRAFYQASATRDPSFDHLTFLSMTRPLYFEPDTGGHRADYLAAYLQHPDARGAIAAPQRLIDALPTFAQARLAPLGGPIALHLLEQPAPVTAKARLDQAQTMAASLACSALFFPDLDPFVTAPIRLGAPGMPISGIYFRPTLHYDHGLSPGRHLRAQTKAILLSQFLRRSDVASVLTLDPGFAQFAQRRMRHGHKLRLLPDLLPVDADTVAHTVAETPAKTVPTTPLSNPDVAPKLRCLLFGALQRRKGVFELLQALDMLPPSDADRVAVRFLGKVFPDAADLPSAIAKARDGQAKITLDDRYAAHSELAQAVAEADVILAPYQRHIGSSGVLYWAAAFGKPVIGQAYGQNGREIRQFGLGAAVATHRPAAIMRALSDAIAGRLPFDPNGARAYLDGHDSTRFAAILHGAFDEPPHAVPLTDGVPA